MPFISGLLEKSPKGGRFVVEDSVGGTPTAAVGTTALPKKSQKTVGL